MQSVSCRSFRILATAALVVVLGGCAVGPDYTPPAPPPGDAYAIPTHTVGDTGQSGADTGAEPTIPPQVFARAQAVQADWYQVFGSQKLNALIKRAIQSSPTLAAGRARIKAAREVVNENRGALYPQINVGAGFDRKRVTGAQFGISDPMFMNVFNLYTAQASASYDLDLFGKTRRKIEAANAAMDEQRYRYIDTYVTLINNVVTSAIAEAGLNASIATTRQLIDSESDALGIVGKQIALGAAIQADATQLQSQLASTRASLEPLEKQKTLAVNRLAVLVGSAPGEFEDPNFTLAGLKLPRTLPVSVPSQLVNQRPDIMAAAAAVHEASARIGVATADLLPDISLSGSYSREATAAAGLGDPINALYSLGAQIAAPIFAGGRLRAQRRQARDLYTASLADYRATALSAFGDVSDALRSIEADARALAAQRSAMQAAQNNLKTTRVQLQNGAADYIGLYTAEAQYQRAKLDFLNARLTRYRDTASLFRALGGGWSPGDARSTGSQPADKPAASSAKTKRPTGTTNG